jgi:hypothetical protein
VQNSPEPDYRRVLRETDAKMKAVAGRLHHLRLLLDGQVVESAVGAEWQPIAGVEGCETRLVPGAFIMEARYEAGAAHSEISVEQAMYGQVTVGRFLLRRIETDSEPIPYEPGQTFYIGPNERHSWKTETLTINVIALIPCSTT